MSQIGKHTSEKVNGSVSSPSKVLKVDSSPENLSHDEKLARVREFFSKGGPKPPPPKPKPKKIPSPLPGEDLEAKKEEKMSPQSPLSPGVEDPGPIVLNMESLNQLSTIMEIDLDAVVRGQDILENQAQKDRAALSQSKGLQSRQLPAKYISKVPQDYAARRRAQTYSSLPKRELLEGVDSPLRGGTPELSEDDKKQRILARSGLSQGSSPLAALGNILKRKNSLKGKNSPKSPKKSTSDSPQSTPKMKKKDSLDASDSGSVSRGFFSSLRRSSSRSSGRKKKGKLLGMSGAASANVSTEDLRTDTSSVISMPIHSPPAYSEPPVVTSTPVKKSEERKQVSTPLQATVTQVSVKDASFRSPGHNRTRDSAIFREASIERLFDSDSSNLFGSSELDAFFKKEKTPERTIPETKEEATPPKTTPPKITSTLTNSETSNKSLSRQSESKTSMRSRLHDYERNQTTSIAEENTQDVGDSKTLENTSVQNKVEDEVSEKLEREKPFQSGSKEKKEVMKKDDDLFPKDPPKKITNLFEDAGDDDLFGPTSQSKPITQSDAAKKKALLDDELFQNDVIETKSPIKKEPPQVRPKKPRKSEESSPKREAQIEAPVSKETTSKEIPESVSGSVEENRITEKTESRPEIEGDLKENKAVSPLIDDVKEVKIDEKLSKQLKADDTMKEEKPEAVSSTFFDDGSELPVYGLRRKPRTSQTANDTEETAKSEEKPVDKKASKGLFEDDEESDLPPFGLRRNRKGKGLFDDHDDDVPPHYGRRMQARRQLDEAATATDTVVDDDKKPTISTTKVIDESPLEEKTPINEDSKEHQQENQSSNEEHLEANKTEEPAIEVTTGKSPDVEIKEPTPEETKETPKEKKIDIKKSSSTRNRSTTEIGTSATGRGGKTATDKKSGKSEPSWVADLKKKRESGEKVSAVAKKTTSTAAKDKDIPEWQKRVLERRKNRAAATESGKSSSTKSSVGTSSPRASRLAAKTEGSSRSTDGKSSPTSRKSPVGDQKSTTGHKSPSTTRKSAIGSKSPKTDTKSTILAERKGRFNRDKDDKGDKGKVDETSTTRATAINKTTSPKTDKPTNTKDKPNIAKKTGVETVTKKITISTSRSSRSSTRSPDPSTKDPKPAEGEDDVFADTKTASECSSSTNEKPKKTSEDANSNTEKPTSESSSSDTTKENSTAKQNSTETNKTSNDGSKTSVSSERERTQSSPFRSHSVSRSPTPSSPTGPLKLKADADIPEWKKKLLEKKKTGSPGPKRGAAGTAKKEEELPAWKKELLAARKPRSSTVATSKPSSSTTRSGRRDKPQETPAFMKEFQKKKEKINT